MSSISTQKLRKLLGLTSQRLGQLAKAGVITRQARGMYDLEASVRGYVEFLRKGVGEEINPAQERGLLHRVQRQLKELELKTREGELIEVAVALQAHGDVTEVAKTRLFAIPDAVAPYLVNKSVPDISAQLNDAIWDAMDEISKTSYK